MKVRDLLELISNLPLSARDKEVYIDVEGDEYKELELCPIVDPADEDDIVGYVICEDKAEPELPFSDKPKEVH